MADFCCVSYCLEPRVGTAPDHGLCAEHLAAPNNPASSHHPRTCLVCGGLLTGWRRLFAVFCSVACRVEYIGEAVVIAQESAMAREPKGRRRVRV